MLAFAPSNYFARTRACSLLAVSLLSISVVALTSPASLLAEPGPWIDLIAKIDGPARGAGGQWTKAGEQLGELRGGQLAWAIAVSAERRV
ncbi:MAG: hypothetical protein R3C99_26975 [Pirellulaceae bacterium]